MSDYSKMFRLAFVLYKEHSLLLHNKRLYQWVGSGNKIPETDQFYSEHFMKKKKKQKRVFKFICKTYFALSN